MREFKFRAWSRASKSIEYINPKLPVGFLIGALSQDPSWVVMQYTGLKDVNGTEIYEGDIVEFSYWYFDGDFSESLLRGEMVYLADCLSFGLRGVKNKVWIKHTGADGDVGDTCPFATWYFDEADFSVLGNIHENPELMEVV